MRSSLTPEKLYEIHAAIGSAVWHLQFLEDVLVTYVTMRLKLKRPVTLEQAQAVLADERRRKTLGALLGEAKAAALVEGNLAEAFQVLLEERNWLVHRSIHECNDELRKQEAMEALLFRLRTLTDRAIHLKKVLYTDVTKWLAREGVDVARAEALAIDQLRRLREP